MSEDAQRSEGSEAKITSSEQPHVKDPRRVEAGRRLGAISKAAKEKKARERYDREREVDRQAERSDDACGMDWTTPLAVLGAVGLIGLCYAYAWPCYILYRKRQRSQPSEEDLRGDAKAERRQTSQVQHARSATAARTPTSGFDNFDE